MIKYFIIFFASLTCFCFGEAYLSDLQQIAICSQIKDENIHQLDTELVETNQALAAEQTSTAGPVRVTNLITYEVTGMHVPLHVGWYCDGHVDTAMNGSEKGKQAVFVNGGVVWVSYAYDVVGECIIHYYPWGRIYTYVARQKIIYY